MSKVIDKSITEIAEEIFEEDGSTSASIIKLIEDMSQDRNLTNDEMHNRIQIIIEAME